ncbi:single-stranded DNA-binding protein [Candidatus Parcubacteria bacterium]|nr:single-stranded DNA-binding protein [Candidatus Parcubacteria bacterium]
MNLNKAMIIGNLTRDPELRNTPNGTPVASFSVATNQIWTDQAGQKQERVEFHNIVAWRRLAEICGQYLKKGAKIYIEGRLQTRDWVGQDGVKRYRTEIVADNMIMLDRIGSTGGGSFPSEAPPAPSESNEPTVESNELAGNQQPEEDEIKVENIPF